MGPSEAEVKTDLESMAQLVDTASRLRAVRTAYRRFLTLWAFDDRLIDTPCHARCRARFAFDDSDDA